MRAVLAAAGVALAVALVGCILFTGGTDGYTADEAGAESGATCGTSACSAGQACCLVLPESGVPGAMCQASCSMPYEQVCTRPSDCGEGGLCLEQTCTLEGVTGQISTCGAIPICNQ